MIFGFYYYDWHALFLYYKSPQIVLPMFYTAPLEHIYKSKSLLSRSSLSPIAFLVVFDSNVLIRSQCSAPNSTGFTLIHLPSRILAAHEQSPLDHWEGVYESSSY